MVVRFKQTFFFFIVLSLFIWGVVFSPCKLMAEQNPDCSYQIQNSLTLSTLRNISILNDIQSDSLSKTIENIDWWIDQAIIELMFLEASYPGVEFPENPIPHSDDPLKFKMLYRKIADYRSNNTRKHKVPLDAESLKLIEDFVRKYS